MAFLLAQDTVSGAEGKVFITRDGKNVEVAGMKNITTNAEIQSNDMRVIGTRSIQNKNNGVKQTGTGNIYYGCTLTGTVPLSILNDEEAMLSYDFNFSYTRVARLQAFQNPTKLGS